MKNILGIVYNYTKINKVQIVGPKCKFNQQINDDDNNNNNK